MKRVKIIKIIFLIFVCLFLICSNNEALASTPTTPASGTGGGSDMLQIVKDQAGQTKTGDVINSVSNISGAVITISKTICVGVAIIMIIVLAMKYLMSAPSDRADIKKHAVVYIVGAVIMFACSGILSIIQAFATNIK